MIAPWSEVPQPFSRRFLPRRFVFATSVDSGADPRFVCSNAPSTFLGGGALTSPRQQIFDCGDALQGGIQFGDLRFSDSSPLHGMHALVIEKAPDLGECEPAGLGALEHGQAVEDAVVIATLSGRSNGFREQSGAFIKPDRRRPQSGPLRDLPNRHPISNSTA